MFEGTTEELKQTKVTQPAVFLHSVILALSLENFKPDMVAGHSLGEISALVANKTLTFESGLNLVYRRAMAMQKACEMQESTDRKSTRLNSSHVAISYAVFCLKKNNKNNYINCVQYRQNT